MLIFKALRVSMEEQRQRQEEEARRAQVASGQEAAATTIPTVKEEPNEEAMLERALAMSMETSDDTTANQQPVVDFANMTEEEQIAFAMQMSMQDARKS